MENKKYKEAKYWHPDDMEWLPVYDDHAHKFLYDKRMIAAEDEGVIVNFTRYEKGYMKPAHTHTCSHGMYVIKGTLRTDEGDFGPGTFVWHTAGCLCTHGATENEDVEFLFIANKEFDIHYLSDSEVES